MINALIVTAVLGTLIATAVNSLDDARQQLEISVGHRATENAIAVYEHALEAGLVNQSTGYMYPNQGNIELALGYPAPGVPSPDVTGLTVITDPAEFPRPAMIMPNSAPTPTLTVRDESAGTLVSYWQLLKAIPAVKRTDASPRIVAYFRGWNTNSEGRSTAARITRVEFGAVRFNDYQLLVDSAIQFGDSATLNGPVHTNGRLDTQVVAGGLATTPTGPVTGAFQNVTCSTNERASVAGRTGWFPPGCHAAPGQGRAISMGAVGEAIEHAVGQVGGGVVFSAPGDEPLIELSGTTASVGGTPYSLLDGGEPIDRTFVTDSAQVRGTVNGKARVTIIATGDSTPGTITVVGNLSKTDVDSTIGLMAKGNVIVESQPCISEIDAAISSQFGAVTIDPALLTESGAAPPKNRKTCGNQLHITGSIASASSPVLKWTFSDGGAHAGYQSRQFDWDRKLLARPVPFSPQAGGWRMSSFKTAETACSTNVAAGTPGLVNCT